MNLAWRWLIVSNIIFALFSIVSPAMANTPKSYCAYELISPLKDEEFLTAIEKTFDLSKKRDRKLIIISDLPLLKEKDFPLTTFQLAQNWKFRIQKLFPFLEVQHFVYQAPAKNNGPLPDDFFLLSDKTLDIQSLADLKNPKVFNRDEIFASADVILAMGARSATSPLKNLAKQKKSFHFRAATMSGFSVGMESSLKLDINSVEDRCQNLKDLLDKAQMAKIVFSVDGKKEYQLRLDLRMRTSTSSSGLRINDNEVGNLPGGETYIVPYEGENPQMKSQSSGIMPLQINDEVFFFRIEENKVVEVIGEGPQAEIQRLLIEKEPAYANIAELGLGVLSSYGVKPAEDNRLAILMNEKLALHIANGLSNHFTNGTVGPEDFSRPENAIHTDWVYYPSIQNRITILGIELEFADQDSIDIRELIYPN